MPSPSLREPRKLWSVGVHSSVSSVTGAPAIGSHVLRLAGATSGQNAVLLTGGAQSLGDFDFEMAVQFDSGTVGGNVYLCSFVGPNFYLIRNSGTGFLRLQEAGTDRIVGSTALAVGTRYTVCLTRSAGVYTLRLDGVSQGTYSSATTLNVTAFIIGSGPGDGVTGYADEAVLYSSAVHTADYTPTLAEIPEGLALNPAWESLVFLLHGDAVTLAPASVAGPDSLALFAPSWPVVPRVTPEATRLDPLRNFGTRGLSGVVDYITSPAAGRLVRAYDKASGILLRETTTAGDGTYSFPDLLGSRDYYVVALDSPPNPASNWDTDISPIVQAT